jgi:predicted nucleic acid-binding Zn ribbon protein
VSKKRTACSKFVPIGSVLDQVIRQYHPIADTALIRVWDIWEKAVGSAIAGCARPAAFKECILLVHVSNSTWLHHLRFIEKELLASINAALGGAYVKILKFKIGPV